MLTPWKDEGFTELRPVQTFIGGSNFCPSPLCEGMCGGRSKHLFATPDNRALALCKSCSESAQKDGAIAANVLI
jgi:hypothetical protein